MQKSEGMEDPRVRRTCQLLQQAFLACTVEKGFASATVSDITERAIRRYALPLELQFSLITSATCGAIV